jgi:uncharacterized integral membrane protein
MRIWVLVVLLLLIAILVAQNTDVVAIRFLMWEGYLSRVVLILLSLVVGIIVGFVGAKLPRGRKPATPVQRKDAPPLRMPER